MSLTLRLLRLRGTGAVRLRPKAPARPPGLPRQGAAPRRSRELPGSAGASSRIIPHYPAVTLPTERFLSHLGTAGDRRLSAAWGGHGAAAGGGGGAPGPPLCSRGRGSRVRRRDEVDLLVGKRGKSRGFPKAAPLHKASSTGEERGGRVAPSTSEAPGPPCPYFPAGSREERG